MRANGGGKYANEGNELRERIDATCMVLIVVDGNKGPGIYASGTREFLDELPWVLERLAAQMRIDDAQHASKGQPT